LTRDSLVTPPRPEQVEISLFGPGFGESVVLHMGFGDWVVVDSCILPRERTPAALAYFGAIGVDPADSVKFVIASHWHDDHIRGLSAVLDRCTKAAFVCPAAVRSPEFFNLAVAAGTRPMMRNPGIKEFADVLSILERRKQSQDRTKGIPKGFVWAAQDRDIWLEGATAKCPFSRQLRRLTRPAAALCLWSPTTPRLPFGRKRVARKSFSVLTWKTLRHRAQGGLLCLIPLRDLR
jgi:Metallo-beta-lactamase superfamily